VADFGHYFMFKASEVEIFAGCAPNQQSLNGQTFHLPKRRIAVLFLLKLPT
jgi:hypothetical protein